MADRYNVSSHAVCYSGRMSVHITYFVHGTTTDNEAGLATGWLPGELSDTGRIQTLKLKTQVADRSFDTTFSSDLQRAVDSADICFGDRYAIKQDRRLRECDYGDLNGGPADNFKNNMYDYVTDAFPNGESYQDVENRMTDFVTMLRKDFTGKHVAIVAHQAPQLALEVILNGKSWRQAIDEDWRRTKDWRPGWEYTA